MSYNVRFYNDDLISMPLTAETWIEPTQAVSNGGLWHKEADIADSE